MVDNILDKTFYGQVSPISDLWLPDALAICNTTRDEHLNYQSPREVMEKFNSWISKISKDKPIFVSDNPAFDWQWINYYFHTYIGGNPFGFSARRIGDFYASNGWKELKKTTHTHHPVDDARGNAEALVAMARMFKIKGYPIFVIDLT